MFSIPAIAFGQSAPTGTIPEAIYVQPFARLDGNPASLSSLRGKTVYIKFWATWCPLCLAGMADFATLAQQSSSDTAIISIITPDRNNEMSKADFIEWAQAQELKFPIWFDDTGALSQALNIRGVPASVYLDPNGKVTKVTMGDVDNEQIQNTLRTIRKQYISK